MQRKFIANIGFLLLVNLLIKPFWILGIDRTVQNTLGADVYGEYFALLNFSFLFGMVLDFGISNFNNRAIARNEGLIEKFMPNIFGVKILLAAGYVLITFITALILGFSGEALYLLGWLIFNQILLSFILYFRSNVAAMQHFRLDALLSIADRTFMILLIGAMLWGQWKGFAFSIAWFIYGQTIAYGLTFLLSYAAVRYSAATFRLRWNHALFKRILTMSAPYALLGILMTLYNRVDGIMIERMLGVRGDQEAGIYAASYRLLEATNMLGFAFATILLPLFARQLKEGISIVPVLRQSYHLLLFIALSVAVGAFTFREPLMALLYTASDSYYATIFGWLMISFVGVATMYVYGSLLTAHGSVRLLNYLAIGGVLLNIVLNAWLIPRQGALGATYATVATQLLVAGGHLIITLRIFHLRPDISLLVRATVFLATAVLLSILVRQWEMIWGIQALALALALLLTGWGFGLLQWRAWLRQ